jgi:hypothetical protein
MSLNVYLDVAMFRFFGGDESVLRAELQRVADREMHRVIHIEEFDFSAGKDVPVPHMTRSRARAEAQIASAVTPGKIVARSFVRRLRLIPVDTTKSKNDSETLRDLATGMPVLGAKVALFLAARQDLIPKAWRWRRLIFCGDIYEDVAVSLDGKRYHQVYALRWFGGGDGWRLDTVHFDMKTHWSEDHPPVIVVLR